MRSLCHNLSQLLSHPNHQSTSLHLAHTTPVAAVLNVCLCHCCQSCRACPCLRACLRCDDCLPSCQCDGACLLCLSARLPVSRACLPASLPIYLFACLVCLCRFPVRHRAWLHRVCLAACVDISMLSVAVHACDTVPCLPTSLCIGASHCARVCHRSFLCHALVSLFACA